MKKRLYPFYLSLFIILVLMIVSASALSIVDIGSRLKGVTGDSTQQSLSVSLTYVQGLPSIQITKPINGTYLTNVSLPLEFTSVNGDNFFYNLDNGQNVSMTGNTRFNTTAGSHLITAFANNSIDTTKNSTSFSVNLTRFFIIYDHYKGAFKGNSTQFYDFTFEQLQNFSDMTLEDARYGKIMFMVPIDVTNVPGNTIDLDAGSNISYNSIYLNAGNLSNLNKDVTIYIYNLTLSNPIVIRNHVACSHAICSNSIYTNGTLIFNATHFAESTFSAQESSAPSPAPPAANFPSGGYPLENVTNVSLPAPLPPCTENWQCSSWGECINETQTRTCSEVNNCGDLYSSPITQRSCLKPINIALIVILVTAAIILMIKLASLISIKLIDHKSHFIIKFKK